MESLGNTYSKWMWIQELLLDLETKGMERKEQCKSSILNKVKGLT